MTGPTPWRLTPYLRPHAGRSALAGTVMTARALVLVLMPWPLKFIIDSVVLSHALPPWLGGVLPDPQTARVALLDVLALAMLVLGAADAWLNYLGNRLFLDIGQRVVLAIRCDLFAHLQRLSLSFHKARRGGDAMARMTNDVSKLQSLVSALGSGVLPHLLTIVGMIVVMVVVDWRYALIALAVVPLLMATTVIWSRRLHGRLTQLRSRDGEVWSMAQETLGAVALVQACGREEYEDRRFAGAAVASLDASLAANRVQAQFAPLINLITAISTGLITWYGAEQVLQGRLTAGELLVFLAYVRGLVTPARQLAKAAPVFGRAAVAIARLRDIFAEQPGIADRPGLRAPPVCLGQIEFRGVSFSHEPGRITLQGISLGAEPGSMAALVGPSGSGKSTLASLAARFADPATGTVLLDGRDLRDLPLAYVRHNVMLMQQDSMLLHGTVWRNIAYGRDGATRDDAIEAARAAGVDDILACLPDGYDQLVGERGGMLSGGQRQCIAIARAMLSDAPVVILDEPSSNLDALTESRIVRAMHKLAMSRTCIVIAHRLGSVQAADRILVMEAGRIVQSGTHDELLALGGLYARMWRTQEAEPAIAQPGA